MTHFNRTLALIAFCCSLQDFAAAQDTLYKRLGGFDAVSAVVEDFAPKLFTDPVVGRYFVGMSAQGSKLPL